MDDLAEELSSASAMTSLSAGGHVTDEGKVQYGHLLLVDRTTFSERFGIENNAVRAVCLFLSDS